VAVDNRIYIRRVFSRFAALLAQLSLAVLMAVGLRFSCVLLHRTARPMIAVTNSMHICYAIFCERMQVAARPQKKDSKSVEGNFVGVQLPFPAPSQLPISSVDSEFCGAR
jgi:hypothetical protein